MQQKKKRNSKGIIRCIEIRRNHKQRNNFLCQESYTRTATMLSPSRSRWRKIITELIKVIIAGAITSVIQERFTRPYYARDQKKFHKVKKKALEEAAATDTVILDDLPLIDVAASGMNYGYLCEPGSEVAYLRA
ncbi:hypothetical protein M9H77_29839 [Catharanthus roseus]|uniref:Uncharacterized protein n=1 Tax=Catharanthus roseus TaxID=4058 RepID=A0ACB9ZY58_CATRO|nr:hypothetical protein M9H77_29839 [Catharanthus roseus]